MRCLCSYHNRYYSILSTIHQSFESIGKSQHRNKSNIECYQNVTKIPQVGMVVFWNILFAYLSLETKKKGDDNGTHKSN